MQQTFSKQDLKKIIKKFIMDKDRGISIRLFAELAGLSQGHFLNVFVYETDPITEITQRRVDKAYKAYINGEVVVMQNRNGTRYVEYRKQPKMLFTKTTTLSMTPDGIKISLGVKPKYDYSTKTLDEQLGG